MYACLNANSGCGDFPEHWKLGFRSSTQMHSRKLLLMTDLILMHPSKLLCVLRVQIFEHVPKENWHQASHCIGFANFHSSILRLPVSVVGQLLCFWQQYVSPSLKARQQPLQWLHHGVWDWYIVRVPVSIILLPGLDYTPCINIYIYTYIQLTF